MYLDDFNETLLALKKEKKQSRIANIFARDLLNSKNRDIEQFFEDIHALYFNLDIDEKIDINLPSKNTKEIRNKDYRIKKLEISNLRGFPSLEDSESIPYGIDFINNNSIESLLILANNGTGKSSLFNALEFLYTNEIGEKKIRTKSTNISLLEYETYLHRFQSTSPPYFKVNTCNGEYSLGKRVFSNKTLEFFTPKSHFITENDIITSGKNSYDTELNVDYTFHNIIAKNLGLQDFIDFSTRLNKISLLCDNKLKRGNSIKNHFLKELQVLNNIIEQRKEILKEISNKKNKLNSKNKKSEESNNLDFKRLLRSVEKNTYSYTKENIALDELMDIFLSKYIRFKFSFENFENFDTSAFLRIGRNLLKQSKDCPLCLNSKLELFQIDNILSNRLNQLSIYKETEFEINELYQKITSTIKYLIDYVNYSIHILANERAEISMFQELDNLMPMYNNYHSYLLEIYSEFEDFGKTSFLKNETDSIIDSEALENLQRYISRNKKIAKYHSDLVFRANEFVNVRKKVISTLTEELNSNKIIFLKDLELESIDVEKSIKDIEQRISDYNNRLDSINNEINNTSIIKNDINEYEYSFNKKKNQLILRNFREIKDTVEYLINEFLDEDIDLKIKLEKHTSIIGNKKIINEYVVAKIYDKHSNSSTTPDIYFNTFRYKLFSLITNLSLALAIRKKYNINLPLIIDDIFYSSDFSNKISFANFLNKTVSIFNRYAKKLPLQLIIFTHDDVIFNSAIDCFDNLKLTDTAVSFNYRVARMFRLEDRDSEPSIFNESDIHFWNITHTI